jgi:hypothetical protein
MKKKQMTLIALLVFAAAGIFGQTGETALVRSLVGTVEMKAPGKTEWEPVRSGQLLSVDAMISTGFKSTATLVLGDSVLLVRPLTRLSIIGLTRVSGDERVELNLLAGRVRAEVKPPSGMGIDFSIRSPTVTASVRGTVFEIDTLNLAVEEGTVDFAGISGAAVRVDAGGTSYVEEDRGRPVSPVETAAASLKPELPPGAGEAIGVNEAAPEREKLPEFSVTVTF